MPVTQNALHKFYALLLKEKTRRTKLSEKYDWNKVAREKQKLPAGNWHIWVILAGRGFGKTRSGAESIRQLVNSGIYKHIGIVANTYSDAREIMIEGESGLLSITPKSEGLNFEPSKRLLTWKNGANARIYSAENIEQLRGPQFDCVWIDELAKFKNAPALFNQVLFCLRLGKNPKIIVTSTPRPTSFIKSLCKMDGVIVTKGSTYENEKNLSKKFISYIREQFAGSSIGAQEIEAEIIDNEKNWWNYALIDKTRIEKIPDSFKFIVISVDPAITSSDNSDETGIIVAGLDYNGYVYILEDASGHFTPQEWCSSVVDLYYRYNANEVVVETNAGGDLIGQLIKNVDSSVFVKKVYAKESKSLRAAPVLILYQQNRVFHSRPFIDLENQMMQYPDVKKSPDRLDALVWAVNYLTHLKHKKYGAWDM